VNIQARLKRTAIGFDTADYLLDMVIDPDLAWEWKDEDEFAEAREAGILEPDVLDAVRAEGERTIADLRARRWPFDTGLESWRPDPGWGVPVLPGGWEKGLVFGERDR
jgi:predicted RNA-binding protein associated with RNAse of E/G family